MDRVWFKNLQAVREAKGYTQVKLSMMVGVSQQSITYYETGTRVPSFDVAAKLAKVLNTSIDYLVGIDNNLAKYYNLNEKDKDTVNRMIDSLTDKESLFDFDYV